MWCLPKRMTEGEEASIRENESARLKNRTEKAVEAIEKVMAMASEPSSSIQFESLANPILIEQFLSKQREYKARGIPWKVDIGYHYTETNNIASIKKHGLLTRADQKKNDTSSSRYTGSFYGDGVYTGDNPYRFSSYGTACLIVARLQGRKSRSGKRNVYMDTKFNTVHRHKEIVLRSSAQCLPLVWYRDDEPSVGPDIDRIEGLLQKHLVDRIFNERDTCCDWFSAMCYFRFH